MAGRATPGSDAEGIAALRDDLLSAGFTASALAGVWGPAAEAALLRGVRLPAVRALADPSSRAAGAVADLAALFVLGSAMPAERVVDALPRLGVEGAEALGLVQADGEWISAAVELRPVRLVDPDGVEEWWVASDLAEAVLGGPLPEDHVLGVGGASRTLAGLQLPRPAGRVLDLGTGSGIQALRAGRYAGHIVGTDVSERALAYARFNAALNGVALELRPGSLFEPVEGERFDRILTNPPFVITPRQAGVPAVRALPEGDPAIQCRLRQVQGTDERHRGKGSGFVLCRPLSRRRLARRLDRFRLQHGGTG